MCRQYSKCFVCINSFTFDISPIKWVLLLSSFYRSGDQGTHNQNIVLKITPANICQRKEQYRQCD